MRKVTKSLVTLGLCTTMLSGMMAGVPTVSLLKAGKVENVYSADNEQVELGDLVLRFLAIGEYEPNRYTKKNGGKWAPEEIEKGLLIKADMVLGEGNVEGMMAPMKYSLQDITGHVDADVNTGNIVITYNGLTLTMKAGSTTAELDNGKEKTTLTMRSEIAPYFKKVDEEKNYLAAFCKMAVIVAVFICFTWNRQLYHKNEIIADLKENITEEANAIRYGEKDLPEGKIKEGIASSEEKRLTVFASEKGKYYLKGYVGSEYHGNRREPLDGKEYGEKYEGIFNRYRADGFHPLAQLYSYCEAAGRQQNGLKKEEKEGTIVVENTGAYERYQYLPYGVDFSSIQCLDTLYRDLNLQKKFWSNREDEKNTYKICMIDEDSLLKTAGVDWQKQTITDEKVRAYADMEMDYRKFVQKRYLALSKKAKEEVAPYVPQKKDNLVSYIEKIRSSLKNAGKEKGDWDALQYASLGTLAFRAVNIPARYVEGYEAVTSDEKDANGNYRADVTGQNAHAWVEIYCDGVGWLPVDVTPGH